MARKSATRDVTDYANENKHLLVAVIRIIRLGLFIALNSRKLEMLEMKIQRYETLSVENQFIVCVRYTTILIAFHR